MIGFET